MGVDQTFNTDAIKAHNLLRALHGCNPIAYDSSLAKQAQAYAEELTKRQRLVNSRRGNYGENLAVKSGLNASRLSGAEVTLMWYGEIMRYDFENQDQSSCGHFCQVVWDETTRAGFGVAKTADGQSVYAVGHYFPPGNFINQWSTHVPRPLGGKVVVPTADFIGEQAPSQATVECQPAIESITTAVCSHIDVVAYRNAMLRAQNAFREGKSLQPLKTSWELEQLAQKYAEGLKSGKHRNKCDWKFNGQTVGQNIMVSRSSLASPETVVVKWMKEDRKYKGSAYPKSLRKSRHYTQMMWASTTEIGTGVVLDERPHRSVVVCFYSPAGNELRGYAKNIDIFRN